MPPMRLACRRAAVQPCSNVNNHPVWITDEVLAKAFQRFAVTVSTPCTRYGSAAPGPLEAQRRLARRRMMGIATAGPGPSMAIPPLFGGVGGTEERTQWTWEPPSLPDISRDMPLLHEPPPVPQEMMPVDEAQSQKKEHEAPLIEGKMPPIPSQADASNATRSEEHLKPDDPALDKAIDLLLADPNNVDPILPHLPTVGDQELSRFILGEIMRRHFQNIYKNNLQAYSRLKSFAETYEVRMSRSNNNSPSAAFTNIISTLHHQKEPYGRTLEVILSLLRTLQRLPAYEGVILRLLRRQKSESRPTIPPALLATEIHRLSKTSPASALKIFTRQRYQYRPSLRLPLSSFTPMLTSLIDAPLHPAIIMSVISSQRDIWTPNIRHTKSPTVVPLRPAHARQVHDVALAFSRSAHLSAREAFRWVLECYRYLHSCGGAAALGTDMTRAMVHAGLTRNLQDTRWTSSVKIRYVLEWVKRLEGDEVAARLDELIYEWRGRVVMARGERDREASNAVETVAERESEKVGRRLDEAVVERRSGGGGRMGLRQ